MALDADGSQYPIEHDRIVSGDLVEVSAQLDIEVAPGPHKIRNTCVYLSFNRVLRVLEGSLLREVGVIPVNSYDEILRADISTPRARPAEPGSQNERCVLPRIAKRQDYRGSANLGWDGNH